MMEGPTSSGDIDFTTLRAGPAVSLGDRFDSVAIGSDAGRVTVRIPSLVEWSYRTNGDLPYPGAFCLPPAIYMRFVTSVAERAEHLPASQWPDPQSCDPFRRSDELTAVFVDLYTDLLLNHEGDYVRTEVDSQNGTDENPVLSRTRLTMPFNAVVIAFGHGRDDHHRIEYLRESRTPVNGRWTYVTGGPVNLRLSHCFAYGSRRFQRDDRTGSLKLELRAARRPFAVHPHDRRPSQQRFKTLVCCHQEALSSIPKELMEDLVYDPGRGHALAEINTSIEMCAALDAAHERAMTGACSSIRDALRPECGDFDEITHPMLDINLTETVVYLPAKNLLRQRLNALETPDSEASPLELLRRTVNVDVLNSYFRQVLGDYRDSGLSGSGTVWQRAKLLRLMIDHSATVARISTEEIISAVQNDANCARADLPLWSSNAMVEPLDATVEGGRAQPGGPAESRIGATLTMDVFLDRRNGGGWQSSRNMLRDHFGLIESTFDRVAQVANGRRGIPPGAH